MVFLHSEYTMPEIWSHFGNMHPDGKPIWSFMFITVACGAISGFHSTQSPLMARCMKSEKQGHFVFYGAMVAEGVIALIWAAAGCSIYEVTGGLNTGLAEILSGGQSAAIYDVCIKTMGSVGVALAMIGVIARSHPVIPHSEVHVWYWQTGLRSIRIRSRNVCYSVYRFLQLVLL